MKQRVFAVTFSVLIAAASAAAQTTVALASLSFPAEVDEWYQKEYQRVEKLCSYPADECWARELRHKNWILNPVHSSPDRTAPRIGDVVAVTAYTRDEMLHLRFDYRPLKGPQVVWLDAAEIGDWGYGIYVVVRAKGERSQGDRPVWIQLAGQEIAAPAWIELNGRALSGDLESLEGRIFRFRAGIRATNRRTGGTAPLPTRVNYLVERFDGSELLLREEVPADLPCSPGDEKGVVTAQTPRYRVAIERLFGTDGKPRMSLAHPRGC